MSEEVNQSTTTTSNDHVLSRARIIEMFPSERDYDRRGRDSKELIRAPAEYAHAVKFVKNPAFKIIDKVRYISETPIILASFKSICLVISVFRLNSIMSQSRPK